MPTRCPMTSHTAKLDAGRRQLAQHVSVSGDVKTMSANCPVAAWLVALEQVPTLFTEGAML